MKLNDRYIKATLAGITDSSSQIPLLPPDSTIPGHFCGTAS